MPPTSLAVASSPCLVQSAMSPAATITLPEGGPGSHSGAQPRARRLPRRATRTIEANPFLLALGGAPSRSEATAEPAATNLSNFETAVSLLITGREDSPRASPPRHRRLHTPDTTPRKQASFGYSPKLVIVEFSEVGLPHYGVLRSSGYSRPPVLSPDGPPTRGSGHGAQLSPIRCPSALVSLPRAPYSPSRSGPPRAPRPRPRSPGPPPPS